jgi:hypothetical protein
MNHLSYKFLIAVGTLIIGITSAILFSNYLKQTEIISPNIPVAVSSPSEIIPVTTKKSLPTKDATPVNSVDFDNFAFPICPNSIKESVPKLKSIKLKDGELEIEPGQFGSTEPYLKFSLENVSYDDLTNDNHRDAIVTLATKYFQGREECTLIYSLSGKKPKLIWTHEFLGGIRKLAFAPDGLMVEEYNDDAVACCPRSYNRMIFNWDGKNFIQTKSEVIPNESNHRDYLGFPNE